MEEIKLTPQELKEAIEFGKLIGDGFFSSVFTYKGRLIKMDNILYNLLKVNDPRISKEVIEGHYKWGRKDFNNRDQLEELSKKQPFIRPKVPEGIITLDGVNSELNGVSPGIIVHPFEGYNDLGKISKNDYKRLLIILKKLFDDIKQLADNEIAQEDIFRENKKQDKDHHFNIIQKGNDAQIIDMSGPLVKVGKDFTDAKRMYSEFAGLINYYYRTNGLKPIYEENTDLTEKELAEMITEFDKQTRNK